MRRTAGPAGIGPGRSSAGAAQRHSRRRHAGVRRAGGCRRRRLRAARCDGASRRARLRLGFAAGDRQHGLADLDRVAFLDEQFGHAAGMGTRDFDDRLVGFQLEDAVVGRDLVAFLDQHVDHVAAMDVLAEFGKLEVDVHVATVDLRASASWTVRRSIERTARESIRKPDQRFAEVTSCPWRQAPWRRRGRSGSRGGGIARPSSLFLGLLLLLLHGQLVDADLGQAEGAVAFLPALRVRQSLDSLVAGQHAPRTGHARSHSKAFVHRHGCHCSLGYRPLDLYVS